jgi:hypothetical protein
METGLNRRESVPSILETDATGDIAAIYADIRQTLGTSVVNLIWRNLATVEGALQWTWSTVKPLYLGPAAPHALTVRQTLPIPKTPPLSRDALTVSGIGQQALSDIRPILDSYHHTNALALVVLSALLERYEPAATEDGRATEADETSIETVLPALPSMAALAPGLQCLILELNQFGEDTEPSLIASMYRHLAYWPPYLALVRTMLAPLQGDGALTALTLAARRMGRAHGRVLARQLNPGPPPDALKDILASCRLFVEHPIARMTGICALIRQATPENT